MTTAEMIDRLTGERDRARDLAAYLENEIVLRDWRTPEENALLLAARKFIEAEPGKRPSLLSLAHAAVAYARSLEAVR